MLDLSRDELQETLKQLEYAIYWHEKWLAGYGGEEFLISLPNTDLESANAIIERMRTGIGALAIKTTAPDAISLTVSFGLALLDAEVSIEESINRADTALYAAKGAGRNRACNWDSTMTSRENGGVSPG